MKKIWSAILAGAGSLCLLSSTVLAATLDSEAPSPAPDSITAGKVVHEAPMRMFHQMRATGDVVGVHFDALAGEMSLCSDRGCTVQSLKADDVVAAKSDELLVLGPGAQVRSCGVSGQGSTLSLTCAARPFGALEGRAGSGVIPDGRRIAVMRLALGESFTCVEGNEARDVAAPGVS